MTESFGAVSAAGLLKRTDAQVNDIRGYLSTGFAGLDALLRRGGIAPKTFCILGGRKGTRKTTVMLNLISRLLVEGRGVGLVGLDESQEAYTLKLMSAMYKLPLDTLEDVWNTDQGAALRKNFEDDCGGLALSVGYRPDAASMTVFLEQAQNFTQQQMDVVFIDYLSLMARPEYGGHNDVSRVPLMLEELQVWTNEHSVVTVVLHQVNRQSDMSGRRNHGDRPLSPEDLAYGGEAIADIILQTYRPALDPIGNATFEEAEWMLPQSWGKDEKWDYWAKASNRVVQYKDSTFLQLTKNRPGVETDFKGLELLSLGTSMKMRTVEEK